MKYDLTTNQFQFVSINFYESEADPGELFHWEYEEQEKMIKEEVDFNFSKYRNDFVPYVKVLAEDAQRSLKDYGLKDIEVKCIKSPNSYNYSTDWAEITVDMEDDWKKIALKKLDYLRYDTNTYLFFMENYQSRIGYIFFGPETWKEFKEALEKEIEDKEEIILSMYLTLAYVREKGNIAEDNWDNIIGKAVRELSYCNYAKLATMIPEDSEYLLKKGKKAERDELYWHVYEKYGHQWRAEKGSSEIVKMLRWAKREGYTLSDLKS